MKLTAPSPEEYATFYDGYVQLALKRQDVLAALPAQIEELKATMGTLSDEKARYRFGPEDWSIKQTMGHINDVERGFSYRMLRVSRNDATPLPGFEQNNFVNASNFDDRKRNDLLAEFEHMRRGN